MDDETPADSGADDAIGDSSSAGPSSRGPPTSAGYFVPDVLKYTDGGDLTEPQAVGEDESLFPGPGRSYGGTHQGSSVGGTRSPPPEHYQNYSPVEVIKPASDELRHFVVV